MRDRGANQDTMKTSGLLAGKRALVTGAGGNLGGAVVEVFLDHGADVAAHTGRGAAKRPETKAFKGRVAVFSGDLTAGGAAENLVADTISAIGPPDILVNCAAVQDIAPIAEQPVEDWSRIQAANTAVAFSLSRCVANNGDDGAIVNIASVEALRPNTNHAAYAASKAALVALTKSLALEYGGKGWRANALAPGLIHRPGLEDDWPEGLASWKQAAPLGRTVQPKEVADACLFLASPLASAVSGAVLPVDCGFLVSPGW